MAAPQGHQNQLFIMPPCHFHAYLAEISQVVLEISCTVMPSQHQWDSHQKQYIPSYSMRGHNLFLQEALPDNTIEITSTSSFLPFKHHVPIKT